MKTMSCNSYVAALLQDLGLSSSKDKPKIKRWVYESLNSVNLYILCRSTEMVKLGPDTTFIDFPKDFVSLQGIKLKINQQCGCKKSSCACVEPYYDTSCNCKNTKSCCPDFTVSMEKDGFNLSSNIADCFTHIEFCYYACPLDEDGSPLVYEKYFEYIRAYVDYHYLKYLRRKNNAKNRSRDNPVNLTDIREALIYLEAKRSEARSKMKKEGIKPALKQIGEKWLYSANTFPCPIFCSPRTFYS